DILCHTMLVYLGVGLVSVLLLTILDVSAAYRSFQTLIPNGARVPDPCTPGTVWPGVGHVTPEGGSDLNSFGRRFIEVGKTWTKALCQEDSDGDGRSNGQELGDPDCSWTPGKMLPALAVSHPGICEPLHSPRCQEMNTWLRCTGTVREAQELAMCGHIAKNCEWDYL
ncbi:hypothetical protein EGW08_023805, partial [Elysia chlorotica]